MPRKQKASPPLDQTLPLYRPSNGTEGDCFEGQWCAQCYRQRLFGGCRIWDAAMGHHVDEPDYPRELVRTPEGPRCTAFRPRDSVSLRGHRNHKPLRGQLTLFGDPDNG